MLVSAALLGAHSLPLAPPSCSLGMVLYNLFYSVIPAVHIMMEGDGPHTMLLYAWQVSPVCAAQLPV
jgi:hypothetical protein